MISAFPGHTADVEDKEYADEQMYRWRQWRDQRRKLRLQGKKAESEPVKIVTKRYAEAKERASYVKGKLAKSVVHCSLCGESLLRSQSSIKETNRIYGGNFCCRKCQTQKIKEANTQRKYKNAAIKQAQACQKSSLEKSDTGRNYSSGV